MIRTRQLSTPLSPEDAAQLRAADVIYLTGTLYTAREEAHQRLLDDLDASLPAPFPLEGAVVYYVGPSPMTQHRPIGAAGPSSASRMDPYAPRLHQLGVRATIGKGRRSPHMRAALMEHGGVYLGATGGAGALLSLCIRQVRLAAYPELGPEAVYALDVVEFPLVVLQDCHGADMHVAPNLEAALSG